MYIKSKISYLLDKKSAVTIALLMAVAYFLYHLFAGNYGIRAESRLETALSDAQSKLTELQADQIHLEKKVRHLHPDSLDKDLLEQCVRDSLAYSDSNELVFIHPKQ